MGRSRWDQKKGGGWWTKGVEGEEADRREVVGGDLGQWGGCILHTRMLLMAEEREGAEKMDEKRRTGEEDSAHLNCFIPDPPK